MVLNLVLIGLAIALDPLPLSAFMVVLPSKRGVRKGAAWTFGWLMSLAIVITVTVLATGNNPPQAEHGALTRSAGGEDRHRRGPGRARDPAAAQDGTTQEATACPAPRRGRARLLGGGAGAVEDAGRGADVK